jgi:hypothetical protein
MGCFIIDSMYVITFSIKVMYSAFVGSRLKSGTTNAKYTLLNNGVTVGELSGDGDNVGVGLGDVDSVGDGDVEGEVVVGAGVSIEFYAKAIN